MVRAKESSDMTTGSGYGDYVTLVPGMDVYASDGDKVGTIQAVTDETITVEKGFFFPKDYLIPISAIEGVDERDRVYLRMTKDAALNEQWDTGWDTGTTVGTTATTDVPTTAREVTTTTDAEATRVPIYEEELTAVKRPVSRGAIRIQKELVTEEKTVTVPVTEERVRITRVDTDAPASADAAGAFEEGYIEVPVTGEEVDLEKTARKTGEVVVEKEAVQRTEEVAGTVRREEVHVDDESVSGDIDTTRGTRDR
jgi:uncharacterized protein (TIGR02271 family)